MWGEGWVSGEESRDWLVGKKEWERKKREKKRVSRRGAKIATACNRLRELRRVKKEGKRAADARKS